MSIPIVNGMASFIPQKLPQRSNDSPLMAAVDIFGSGSVIIQLQILPGKDAIIGSIKPLKGALGKMKPSVSASGGMLPTKGALGRMKPEQAASGSLKPAKGTVGKLKEDP